MIIVLTSLHPSKINIIYLEKIIDEFMSINIDDKDQLKFALTNEIIKMNVNINEFEKLAKELQFNSPNSNLKKTNNFSL